MFSGRSQIAVCRIPNPLAGFRFAATPSGAGYTRSSRAFTLIEMVVSLSILSIVFLAMGSVMMLSAHAVPSPDAPATLALNAADIVERITDELQFAVTVPTADEHSISFTVADRDSDGDDEAIIYRWDGAIGGNLTRSYNGTISTLLTGVQSFSLTYDMLPPPPAPIIEGAEQLFLVQNSDNAGYGGTYAIDSYVKIAQYVEPSLPADAESWGITRVYVGLMSDGPKNGKIEASIMQVDSDGKPGSTLDTYTISESSLSTSAQWCELTFDDAVGLEPGSGAFVSITEGDNSLGDPGKIVIGFYSSYSPNENVWFYHFGWSEQSDNDMRIYVYGTVWAPDPDWVFSQGFLNAVTCALNTGEDTTTLVQTRINVMNRPEVP